MSPAGVWSCMSVRSVTLIWFQSRVNRREFHVWSQWSQYPTKQESKRVRPLRPSIFHNWFPAWLTLHPSRRVSKVLCLYGSGKHVVNPSGHLMSLCFRMVSLWSCLSNIRFEGHLIPCVDANFLEGLKHANTKNTAQHECMHNLNYQSISTN